MSKVISAICLLLIVQACTAISPQPKLSRCKFAAKFAETNCKDGASTRHSKGCEKSQRILALPECTEETPASAPSAPKKKSIDCIKKTKIYDALCVNNGGYKLSPKKKMIREKYECPMFRDYKEGACKVRRLGVNSKDCIKKTKMHNDLCVDKLDYPLSANKKWVREKYTCPMFRDYKAGACTGRRLGVNCEYARRIVRFTCKEGASEANQGICKSFQGVLSNPECTGETPNPPPKGRRLRLP